VVAAKIGRVADTLVLADLDEGADPLVDHNQDGEFSGNISDDVRPIPPHPTLT